MLDYKFYIITLCDFLIQSYIGNDYNNLNKIKKLKTLKINWKRIPNIIIYRIILHNFIIYNDIIDISHRLILFNTCILQQYQR